MIQTVASIFKENFTGQEERKKTILLVEDEAIIAFSETQRLEKNGYKVIPAYSAEEAIRIATNDYTIDLILMDIDLREEEDGTDTALKILKLREIPIVFLSSHTEPEVVAKTEKITSYGYVVKNSGETVLLASIKMAFKLYESHLRLKRSEESLKENQELLEATLRSIGDGVISTDELGNITDMNYVAEVLTGWRAEDAIREPIERVFKIVNARTRRRIRNPIDHVTSREKIMGLENEALLLSKSGAEYRISETSAPIRSARGYTIGSVLVFRDISKECNLLESLSKDLEEREFLFQELQHRTKNSLTMISSIIEIEAENSSEINVKHSLANIVHRIHSVGNLYDMLYTSKGLNIVRLDKYIDRISITLLNAFHQDTNRISLLQDLEPLEMDAKTAIPFGLVVNELLTNTLKYAFPGNKEGKVHILLRKEGTVVNLEVSDNGVPFPEDFDLDSSEGLGLKLVKLLVTQMKGDLHWKFNGEKKIQIRLCVGE
ncbi:response regulator [Leptospira langatensis]|uniref:histidine kinase n=1 Tax=Leptospira langatensis TaxID=2484983 RepID=A0A5F1ZP87_9LEPT|nr:response regulator [Leptospira langatensis]TGK05509.1 response regulator [Leptospira langatensis]TGL38645.1 response regulator [Leptospira langatensis]